MARHKHSVYKCRVCGGPVSDNKAKGKGRCVACYWKERRAEQEKKWADLNKNEPHFCVICGKQFEWTPTRAHRKVTTCSRHCAGLLRTSRLKETPEHLEERLVTYIREQNKYVMLRDLCKFIGCTEKYIKERGLTVAGLHEKAGIPMPRKYTPDELKAALEDLLVKNPHITRKQALAVLGVSNKQYLNSGVRIAAIRQELGLGISRAATKEELEARILSWLKEQSMYRPAYVVCDALGIDISAILRTKISIPELNERAGHKHVSVSYPEDLTNTFLLDAGFTVQRQKTFPGCKNVFQLKYDFFLPEYNVLLEVDGSQHYDPTHPHYQSCRRNDEIKNKFAESNGILLFRIKIAPSKTFADRLRSLIEHIKGLPRVSEEVHTDSNCGELPPGDAEDNPQPSSNTRFEQMEFDF